MLQVLGASRPEWLLTGWKTGGCRMKVSGIGSSFSPGDMGGGAPPVELLILIWGPAPLG